MSGACFVHATSVLRTRSYLKTKSKFSVADLLFKMNNNHKPLLKTDSEYPLSYYASIGPLVRPRPHEKTKPDTTSEDSSSEVEVRSKPKPRTHDDQSIIEELQREIKVWREQSHKHMRLYMEAKDFETQNKLLKVELEKIRSANFVLEQHNESLREDTKRAQIESDNLVREKERERYEHEIEISRAGNEKCELVEQVATLKQELKEANDFIAHLQQKVSDSQKELDRVNYQVSEIKSSNYAVKKIQQELDRMEFDLDSKYKSKLRQLHKDEACKSEKLNGRNEDKVSSSKNEVGEGKKSSRKGRRSRNRLDDEELDSYLVESIVADTVDSIENRFLSFYK